MESMIKIKNVVVFLMLLIPSVAMSAEFYIVRYEGYSWSPCSSDNNGLSQCFAINCGLEGCKVPTEDTICLDKACVIEKIKARGEGHLAWIYRIEYANPYNTSVIAEKMELQKSFELLRPN
jgi:hypothetical protein